VEKLNTTKTEAESKARALNSKLRETELTEQELRDELDCEKKRADSFQFEMRSLDEKAKESNRLELIISDLRREISEKTLTGNALMEKAALAYFLDFF
jgi:hypothetical protein